MVPESSTDLPQLIAGLTVCVLLLVVCIAIVVVTAMGKCGTGRTWLWIVVRGSWLRRG